jgi:hypothetical protein
MVSSACWRACVSSRISCSSSSILRRRRSISSPAPSRATVRGDAVIDCSSRRSCPSALDQANASAAMVPAQSATTASMTSRRTTLCRRRRTTAAGSWPNSSSNVSSFGISAICNGIQHQQLRSNWLPLAPLDAPTRPAPQASPKGAARIKSRADVMSTHQIGQKQKCDQQGHDWMWGRVGNSDRGGREPGPCGSASHRKQWSANDAESVAEC